MSMGAIFFTGWFFGPGWRQSTVQKVTIQLRVHALNGCKDHERIQSLDAYFLTGYSHPLLKIRLQSARHSETLVWKLGATLTNRRLYPELLTCVYSAGSTVKS